MSIKSKIIDFAVRAAEDVGERAVKATERKAVKKAEKRTLAQIMDTIPEEARASFRVRPAEVAKPEPRIEPRKKEASKVNPTPRGRPAEVAAPEGIIAYHGSPHSFDRFDISKIGTGEGAQAYGHGLYFAEAEPVAQEYRQRLAEVTAAPFDRIGVPPQEWNAATMFARQMDPSLPDVAARDFAQWVGRDVTPELVDAFRVAKNPGSMYQVKLNVRPEDLLDWDRALYDQGSGMQSGVMDAVNAADLSHLKPGSRPRVKLDRFMEGTEQPHDRMRGLDLLMALDQTPGNNFAPQTSALLKDVGVPGIQYLDQASRAAGEGTRNYVMFSDDLIDLLRKYAMGGSV